MSSKQTDNGQQKKMYIFSIKFTDCLDFDLSVLIKTSIFINYQNIRYHE